MLTIATFYSCNYIRLMKVIAAIFLVISGVSFAQSYESLAVNLRDASAPDLEAYQANVRGYEWTVKNGSAAVNLTGNALEQKGWRITGLLELRKWDFEYK